MPRIQFNKNCTHFSCCFFFNFFERIVEMVAIGRRLCTTHTQTHTQKKTSSVNT